MKNTMLFALSFCALAMGCAAEALGEESAEAQGISFFGDDAGTNYCGTVPKIIHPQMVSGNMLMDAACSVIQPNATLRVANGAAVTSFTLRFDDSGTRFKALNVGAVIPQGACRTLNVINPNGVWSDPVTFCR